MEQNRRTWLKKIGIALAGASLIKFNAAGSIQGSLVKQQIEKENAMKLGAFSVSLNVKDINASKQFYENLGFKVFGGDIKKNYLILKNGNALIGLFYGMFDKTILTFNPGWDENAKKMEAFEDVREIQRQLKVKGIKLESEADENTTGPASLMVLDPDGNTILLDQHV